ncbi:hypothetical protein Vi05172_g6112 [Venturia inaequalis]|uniref:Uncharacterized protein n=1 Tax=Venturia inaequalis TaxID=5025 RepID=A0A8H3Z3K6_VENIN|nr:hypothetical protein EG327_006052 [Venturia inaequalis]RDI83770.1 hypothetical protein Vi05172_g6112 [Venturia inaequalis]
MLSSSVIALVLACTGVLAAPLVIKPRVVKDYGKYASYGSYPPPPSYSGYGKYSASKRSARIETRDVERRLDDHADGADTSYGKYASYDVSKADSHVGNYGKYADYGKYKSGSKRDGIVKDREAEAAPAPVPENE